MCFQEVTLYCLATGNVDVNARDNAGYTPLHECCVRGHRAVAIQLLKYGADVNCCSVDGIRYVRREWFGTAVHVIIGKDLTVQENADISC